MDNKAILSLSKVSFNYGSQEILKDVSFDVAEGDYLGIIGPNGGGKTTLLKIILGIFYPESGEIKIFGKKPDNSSRKEIGYVPQGINKDQSYFPATVWEVVKSGRVGRLGLFKFFKKNDLDIIENSISQVGLSDYKDFNIGNLSGGQRQRVFIARALAASPKVLLLDEPSFGIDVVAQKTFYGILDDLNKKGLTVIFISHDIDILASKVKTILCLNREIVCHGPPDNYFKEEYLKKLYGVEQSFPAHKHI